MAHEITSQDGLVLAGEKAWHNLGLVVPETFTPVQGLEMAKLDRAVVTRPLAAQMDDGSFSLIEDRRAVMYADSKESMGEVSDNWTPIQNRELAEFCEALAKESDTVKCETVGSIRSGAKVWFLMRGESFSVRNHDSDEIRPYILASNGHDGKTSLRLTPTSVRIVCSNTLHAVIPDETGKRKGAAYTDAAFVATHTGNIMNRMEEARQALGLYVTATEETRKLIDVLAAREVNSDEVKSFLLECYARDFGSIPVDPKNEKDVKAREKASTAIGRMIQGFESESGIAGTTAWNLFNAYSGHCQHVTRLKDADKAREAAAHSNLFGLGAARTSAAFRKALKLVV